jgi:hypothetical protein
MTQVSDVAPGPLVNDIMVKLQVKLYFVQNFVKIRGGRLNSLFDPYRE